MGVVSEILLPGDAHVLEELPAEDGKDEGKRVEVAPFIGRALKDHQVRVWYLQETKEIEMRQ